MLETLKSVPQDARKGENISNMADERELIGKQNQNKQPMVLEEMSMF